MSDGFLITIRSQPKHGALYAAAKRYGSIVALAKTMRCSTLSVSNWINLRGYPRSCFGCGQKVRRERIESGLQEVVGITIEECWPQDVRDFIDRTRELKSLVFEQTKLVPLARLNGAAMKLLTVDGQQEEAMEAEELRQRIGKVLKTLSYREREIIKLRYGLGEGGYSYTLEEVGHIFKVTGERIHEIEAKALRKLQQPSKKQELVGFID